MTPNSNHVDFGTYIGLIDQIWYHFNIIEDKKFEPRIREKLEIRTFSVAIHMKDTLPP